MGLSWEEFRIAVAATLDDLPELLFEVKARIAETVPDYALVSDEELTAASDRNIRGLLNALHDRRYLQAAELQDFADTVEERARNGVPVEQYLLAVTTAEAVVWEALWRRAASVGDEVRSEAFALRFANVQLVTRTTVAAHRRIELRAAREDQERRAVALRLLLRGGIPADEVRDHLARLGLAADRSYYVVRARARGDLDSDRLVSILASSKVSAPHAAFVLWGDDVVGLLRESPVGGTGFSAGVAGPVDASRLAEAHTEATTSFQTAWALRLDGVHTLADLGIRAAVQASPQVGVALRERYLAPLLNSGSLGTQLLATTRAYLEAGSSRDLAASRLHLHANTVGYRLGRFAEITGANLTDLSTLAELHWLFVDLDLRPI